MVGIFGKLWGFPACETGPQLPPTIQTEEEFAIKQLIKAKTLKQWMLMEEQRTVFKQEVLNTPITKDVFIEVLESPTPILF